MIVTAIHLCYRKRSRFYLFRLVNNSFIIMEEFECYYEILQNHYIFNSQCVVISHLQLDYTDFKKIKSFFILYKLSLMLSIPTSNMIRTMSIHNNRHIYTDDYTRVFLNPNTNINTNRQIFGFNVFDIIRIKHRVVPLVLRCILDHIEECIDDCAFDVSLIEADMSYQSCIAYFLRYMGDRYGAQETLSQLLEDLV